MLSGYGPVLLLNPKKLPNHDTAKILREMRESSGKGYQPMTIAFGSLIHRENTHKPSSAPYVPAEGSYCGKKGIINAIDAPGVKACRECGNYHK